VISRHILLSCDGFQWDKGNRGKNLRKHDVSDDECEEVLTNYPLFIDTDELHSHIEPRYHGYGITDLGRMIFIGFTIRGTLIRPITARVMNKKERKVYENEIKKIAGLQE
jgi:uncharacterized DUF497 family protein